MKNDQENVTYRWPVSYKGSIVFLVITLLIWPPIGILLLCKNGYVRKKGLEMHLQYHGSWFWLFFWSILFFPVAFLLLLIRGVDVISSTLTYEELS